MSPLTPSSTEEDKLLLISKWCSQFDLISIPDWGIWCSNWFENQQSFYVLVTPKWLHRVDVNNSKDPFALLSMAEERNNIYSVISIKQVTLARNVRKQLSLPSDQDFIAALEDEIIQECMISRRRLQTADIICNPNKHSLFGKFVQQTNKMPSEEKLSNVPPAVIAFYRNVTARMTSYMSIESCLYLVYHSILISYNVQVSVSRKWYNFMLLTNVWSDIILSRV